MDNKPKRKFTPKAVSRRSEQDRQSTAPAIKQEEQQPEKRQDQNAPRRRRVIKGEYLDEVQGPLSAPSLVDPRGQRRSGHGFSTSSGQTGGGSASGGARAGVHAQQQSGQGQASESNAERIDVSADNGYYSPQVVSKQALRNSEMPQIDPANLYLFSIPPTTKSEDSMEVDGSLQIGSLRQHASGRITMLINDQVYQVTAGVPSSSVQDILLVKDQIAYKLGCVEQRMVLIPQYE